MLRPLSDIVIPDIARGYEDIYRRFFMGKLIYSPDSNSDQGRIVLPIRDLSNPLAGKFDLSQCGDSGQYVSIATGYRTGKDPTNANKLEIWIAPRGLIERNLETSASHFQSIMDLWNANEAPVGLFWIWGRGGCFDYLITDSLEKLGGDLFEKHKDSRKQPPRKDGIRGRTFMFCF